MIKLSDVWAIEVEDYSIQEYWAVVGGKKVDIVFGDTDDDYIRVVDPPSSNDDTLYQAVMCCEKRGVEDDVID